MLAEVGDIWTPIVGGAVGMILLAGLSVVIVNGYRRFNVAADRSRLRAFAGATISEGPAPGLVAVVFHTYSGVVLFTHQVEHRFGAAPNDALLVLARLHRFNLAWGFFAYGGLFIPLLSYVNYELQRKKIEKLAAQLKEP